MAVIKMKNVLRFGEDKRRRWWKEAKESTDVHHHYYLKDIVPGIPFFIKANISIAGVLEFLIGDEPAEMTTYTVSPIPEV